MLTSVNFKCFVFDDTMKRQEELDFHSVNIRRGRHKSWIDLWRSNEIFQMISLTGMLVNYLKNSSCFGSDRQT